MFDLAVLVLLSARARMLRPVDQWKCLCLRYVRSTRNDEFMQRRAVLRRKTRVSFIRKRQPQFRFFEVSDCSTATIERDESRVTARNSQKKAPRKKEIVRNSVDPSEFLHHKKDDGCSRRNSPH